MEVGRLREPHKRSSEIKGLPKAGAQVKSVHDGRDEGREVEERGDAVELAELLIQLHHLLGVRLRVIRLLPILLLFQEVYNIRTRPRQFGWVLLPIEGGYLPCSLLFAITPVVAGSKTTRLTRAEVNMVATGASAVHLFSELRSPSRLKRLEFPGWVMARTTGAAVWREK